MSGRSPSQLQQARLRGAREAARQHGRLYTDFSKRISIFSLIEQHHCWLIFQPLKNIYGAYLEHQDGAGILINANHPVNLQRLTAAHEFGHAVLGHGSSFDGEEQIEPTNRSHNLQEVEAQSFAAHFLMPIQSVNAGLQRLGTPPNTFRLTPKQIYRLSLELGASYSAVVNHLVTLQKISFGMARTLLRKTPKNIKAEIGAGRPPQNPWADVWELGASNSGETIFPRIFDEIHIRLPEDKQQGFSWHLLEPALLFTATTTTNEQPVILVLDEHEQPLLSSTIRHLVFRVLKPAMCSLRLACFPVKTPSSVLTDLFEVNVHVQEHPCGAATQGLIQSQKRLL